MRLGPIIVCSNEDSGLTLTYFKPGSNFVAHASVWGVGGIIFVIPKLVDVVN